MKDEYAKVTTIRLSLRGQEILEDLRAQLGSKYSRPSVSKVLDMILKREIDLDDFRVMLPKSNEEN